MQTFPIGLMIEYKHPNFEFLKENVPKQRVTLLQGSTRSMKTWDTIYYIIYLCKKHKGMEIDIVRDTYTALKATVWKDFKAVLLAHGLYDVDNHNKSDHIYLLNDNVISYYGADDPDKIHGRSRDILWCNEAHQLKKETIDQLFPRTRSRIIGDYNPALGLDHWLDPYIEKFPPLITTYLDNPYLTKSQVEDIESRKGDKYWWAVYGTGQRSVRAGVVFQNWEIGSFDEDIFTVGYGQDFGFNPDPTTLVKVAVDKQNKKVYIDEQFYNANELKTEEIYQMNKSHIDNPNSLIVADSAEPRLITEVNEKGLNIIRAKKGAGSVLYGITKLNEYQMIVTPESKNTIKELSKYVWNNKKAGIPIDKHNHIIDAIRYIFTNLIGEENQIFQYGHGQDYLI